MRGASIAIGFAAGLLVAGSAAAVFGLRAPTQSVGVGPVGSGDKFSEASWSETKWPFLQDQWGIGKAFVCMPADCGRRIEVFIRPKIGFCNCSTGVSDDNELERVADTDLVSPSVRPLGQGSPVKVGWMRGLGRLYATSAEKADERVMSVAFNDECDVVVAVATLGKGDPEMAAHDVMAFLKSTPTVLWAKKELGLEFVRREW
jgi:hypothetical protein